MAKSRTSTKTAAQTEETKATEETQSTESTTEETQATEETTPETTQEETTPAPTEETEQKDEPVQTTQVSAPSGLEALATKLQEYIVAMQPNKIMDADEIVRNQMRLRSIINTLLSAPDDKFKDAMKLVVGAIRKERTGVFSERLVFRGFPQLRIARNERQKLETLISLLLATADAQQPAKVKNVVDMDVAMRYVNNDDQQQKLQSYYGL